MGLATVMPAEGAQKDKRWVSPQSIEVMLLSFIVLLAIVLRVAWGLYSEARPARDMDTFWYDSVAQELANGHEVANPEDGAPTAFWPPGYPLVLAGVYKLAGHGVHQGQTLNAVVGALTVLATYGIGRIALGRSPALLGAAILAVFPSQVIYSSLMMSDVLFTFFFVVAIGVVVLYQARPDRPKVLVLVAGLACGAAALVRGEGMGLPLVLGAWIAIAARTNWRQAIGSILLLLVGSVLVVAPWTVRNVVRLHAFVPVSTNAGWDAVIGHNEFADGGWMDPGNYFLRYAQLPDPQKEVEVYKAGLRMASSYARTHIGDEARLTVRKVKNLWMGDADAIGYQEMGQQKPFLSQGQRFWLTELTNDFYFVILLWAIPGLVLMSRRHGVWLSMVVLLAVYWTGFHVLTFGENRFHYPLAPILSLTAAAGIIGVVSRFDKAGKRRTRDG
ncbi:MAG: glycosyltransferase family 39 protein [Dehalococcoidia bacterium]